jgi:hypothetical protein
MLCIQNLWLYIVLRMLFDSVGGNDILHIVKRVSSHRIKKHP